MLSDSQKLTDGLIIYSALISDFEKLDFKNDALAGVRANYFNSQKQLQSDRSDILLDDKTYNISYKMKENEPLSWKITRNNKPVQSVKKAINDVYSVIFYGENGIIYKRSYYDKNHSWIRTDYFSEILEGVKIGTLMPRIECGITVLELDRIDFDGKHSISTLFPSATPPAKKSSGLIYSNEGMIWYDETFKPKDMKTENISTDSDSDGGFKFFSNADIENTQKNSLFNIKDAEYLDISDISESDDNSVNSDLTDNENLQPENQEFSAYDKIANILNEAHKTNKDLFGEIINQTSDDEFNTQTSEEISENISDDSISENEQTTNEQTTSITSSEIEHNADNGFDNEDINEEYEIKEIPESNAKINTKAGKYSYFGKIDENNKRIGRGRTVTPDGFTSYDGEYLDDKRNGFGVCYYKEGKINYVGNWINGNREGCGVGYRLSDGTMHAGKWSDNLPEGCGARFDADGNFIDVCFYKNGQKNGKSVSFDEKGRVVIKKWIDGELIFKFIVDEEE